MLPSSSSSTRAYYFTARIRLHRNFTKASGRRVTRKKYESLSVAGNAISLPEWDGGLQPTVKRQLLSEPEFVSNVKSAQPVRKATRSSRKVPIVPLSLKGSDPNLSGKEVTSQVNPDRPTKREPRNQLAQEIRENQFRFPHCVLLTRVGQFYESYFEPARDVARILSIKLTQRVWDGVQVPMCGFPVMHLEKYIKVLVQENKLNVALCEETQRPREGENKTIDRSVVRILTPGTLIDESFLNPYENNYLLAISLSKGDKSKLGLAWIDLPTGELFTQNTRITSLADDIARINPREIVLDVTLKESPVLSITTALKEQTCPISYSQNTEQIPGQIHSTSDTAISDDVTIRDPDRASTVFDVEESAATRLLESYLRTNLFTNEPLALAPMSDSIQRRMQIDAHTLKALEIRESTSDGHKGKTLLNTIKRTDTPSGTRLLTRWLSSPSTSINEIEARQSLVELFYTRPFLRQDIRKYVGSAEDATRIVQRFQMERGDFDDLLAMKRTINVWSALKEKFIEEKSLESREKPSSYSNEWSSADMLLSRMSDLRWLADRISDAVEENDSSDECTPKQDMNDDESDDAGSTSGQWSIKPQFSSELTDLHAKLSELNERRVELQSEFQRHYSAPSLTLRISTSYLGFHVHIAKPKRDLDKILKSKKFSFHSESNSTKSYSNEDWCKLAKAIVDTTAAIRDCEMHAFKKLKSEVVTVASKIRLNARVVDELDVTLGFARAAEDMNLTRPKMVKDNGIFNVVNGRHATVESALLSSGRAFNPNSLNMSHNSRLHVITGPNMAGKSTYLRQIALIAILAQTGSYVPAEYAEIGIVDQVFSRIGARDDLAQDKSTFMVEMLETAEILKNATPNSLVLMDEVGRGTTVKDGIAIAFATIFHLCSYTRCRTLFATHFHELADMLGYSNETHQSPDCRGVAFFCTDVHQSEDGHVTYSHRLRPGVNRNSHGLIVARLANIPASILEMAEKVSEQLDKAMVQPDIGVLRTMLSDIKRDSK